MEIHQIECVLAVHETGSFRSASMKLNKAQSAVSLAIKNLESELGIQIFDRTQYRPILSSQGQSLLPQLISFQQQMGMIQNQALFLKKGHEPRMILAVSALWPERQLTEVVQKFTEQFPFTELILKQEVLSADEMLLEDQADLALSVIFDEADLFEKRPMGATQMLTVAHPKHPLALKKKSADLRQFRQVVVKSTYEKSVRMAGVESGQPQIGVHSLSLKKQLILCGVGWGALPDHMIKAELKSKQLVSLGHIDVEVPFQLAWKKKKSLGPCAQFLISTLEAKNMNISKF